MLTFDVLDPRRLICCRAEGELDFLQTTDTLRQLLTDRSLLGACDTLFVIADRRTMDALSRLGALKPVLACWNQMQAGRRWAVVVPDGGARLAVESHIPSLALGATDTRCFTSLEMAEEWLATPALLQTQEEAPVA